MLGFQSYYLNDRTDSPRGGNVMKVLLMATLLFVICVPAFAADVDGKWAGTVQTLGGDMPVSFTFKADGEKLTGTTLGLDGMEVPITDGKIDAKGISFKLSLDFGGMAFVLNYKGVVSAEEIKMTVEAEGLPMPLEFVLKK